MLPPTLPPANTSTRRAPTSSTPRATVSKAGTARLEAVSSAGEPATGAVGSAGAETGAEAEGEVARAGAERAALGGMARAYARSMAACGAAPEAAAGEAAGVATAGAVATVAAIGTAAKEAAAGVTAGGTPAEAATAEAEAGEAAGGNVEKAAAEAAAAQAVAAGGGTTAVVRAHGGSPTTTNQPALLPLPTGGQSQGADGETEAAVADLLRIWDTSATPSAPACPGRVGGGAMDSAPDISHAPPSPLSTALTSERMVIDDSDADPFSCLPAVRLPGMCFESGAADPTTATTRLLPHVPSLAPAPPPGRLGVQAQAHAHPTQSPVAGDQAPSPSQPSHPQPQQGVVTLRTSVGRPGSPGTGRRKGSKTKGASGTARPPGQTDTSSAEMDIDPEAEGAAPAPPKQPYIPPQRRPPPPISSPPSRPHSSTQVQGQGGPPTMTDQPALLPPPTGGQSQGADWETEAAVADLLGIWSISATPSAPPLGPAPRAASDPADDPHAAPPLSPSTALAPERMAIDDSDAPLGPPLGPGRTTPPGDRTYAQSAHTHSGPPLEPDAALAPATIPPPHTATSQAPMVPPPSSHPGGAFSRPSAIDPHPPPTPAHSLTPAADPATGVFPSPQDAGAAPRPSGPPSTSPPLATSPPPLTPVRTQVAGEPPSPMPGDYRPDPVVEPAASTASSGETAHTDHADESTPAHEVRCPTCLNLMADDRALRHHTPHCTPSNEARHVQARQEAASVGGSLSRPGSSVPVFSDMQWAQLDSVDWRKYFSPSRTHARPLRRIPPRVRGGISDVLRAITARMEQYPDADGPHFLFTAVPTLFLAPATPPERGHTASIAARIARFFRGEWDPLFSDALRRRTPLPTRTSRRTPGTATSGDERRIAHCLRLAACNETSRACAALESAEAAPDTDRTVHSLRAKHPSAERPLPEWLSTFHEGGLVLSATHLRQAIFTASRGSSGGPTGWVAEHLRDTFLAFPHTLPSLLSVYQLWLGGRCPSAARSLLASSTLVALAKPNGDVRPIAIGEVLVRVLSRAVCLQLRDQMARVFLASQQFGVGVTCGTEVTVRGVVRALADHPGWVVLQLDVANAFNSFFRDVLFQALHASPEFRCLIPFIRLFYGTPSDLIYRAGRGVTTMHSERGTRQGDPLSPFLYALTQRLALEPVLAGGDVQLWSYADDTYLVGPPDRVLHHFTEVVRRLGELGLAVQPHKCLVHHTSAILPSEVQAFTGLGIEVARRGLTVTGVPVGTDTFVRTSLRDRLERMAGVLLEGASGDQTEQQPAQQQQTPAARTGRIGAPARIPDLTCRAPRDALMVIVDVSVADPQREGNAQFRRMAPTQIGGAAARWVQDKLRHWRPVLQGVQPDPEFYACVVETFGCLSEPLRQFLGLCASRTARRRRDSGAGDDGSARIFETSLTTRLSVALQRAQANVIMQHAVRQLGGSDNGWMPAPVPLGAGQGSWHNITGCFESAADMQYMYDAYV
ncbi:hypothetical protein CLOP_g12390 [Closterium sp. NIES-67]|nr:hypothetical protein CLOP_g12390 [Closterium sp. NIES-67]